MRHLSTAFIFLLTGNAPAAPPGGVPVRDVAPRSLDGTFTAAILDGATIQLVNNRDKHTRQFGVTSVYFHALAFSFDGRSLAAGGSDRLARVWSTATGKEMLVLKGHQSPVRAVAFAPDGRYLASAAEQECLIWELASGQHVLQLPGLADVRGTIVFRPDSKGLLVADLDQGSVTSFALADGKQLGRWTLERLQVVADAVLARGKRTTFRVRAQWSGGTVQDVTAWASCGVADDQVARFTRSDQVEAVGSGRTAITARYLGREAAVALGVPFAAVAEYPRFDAANFIDELLVADWKRLNVVPAPLVGDSAFLRRVTLHLTGTQPTPEAVRAFLANKDADRRTMLIDNLLNSPQYAEHWGQQWSSLFGVADNKERRSWFTKALSDNWPADRLTRAALGRVGGTPQTVADTVGQVFLGIEARCARCHRHPSGAWGRDDYRKSTAAYEPDSTVFARNLVNRYWAHLFGRGLIESCDDLRPANLPSQPELLETLARDFIKHKYDLKRLLRTICQARAYQLGTLPGDPDSGFFNRRLPQRLEGERLLRVVANVVGVEYNQMKKPPALLATAESGPFRRVRTVPVDHGGCERLGDRTPSSILVLMNWDTISEAVKHPQGRLARLLAAKHPETKIIDELFLSTLARSATNQEVKMVTDYLAKMQGEAKKHEAYHDFLWALVNAREFLFIP